MKTYIHFASSFNFIARSKDIVPQNELVVNKKIASIGDLMLQNPGVIIIKPNQPAEKLVSNPDKTSRRDLVSTFFTKYYNNTVLI